MPDTKPETWVFSGQVLEVTTAYRGLELPNPTTVVWPSWVARGVRVLGTIHEHPIDLMIQTLPTRNLGLWVGGPLRKSIEKARVDIVTAAIYPNPNPEAVDLPEVLTAQLAYEPPEVQAWFENLTAGQKRGFSTYLRQAKHIDTQIRRAAEIIDKYKNGRLYIQRNPKRTD